MSTTERAARRAVAVRGLVLLLALATVLSSTVAATVAPGAGGPAMAAQTDTAFERSTVEVPAGDIARFDISVPDGATGTVTVGSPDVGYVASVEFDDADESGNVSLSMNTYLAGRSAEEAGAAWTASDGDRIRSVDLRTDPLSDPLDPAVYDVNVTVDGREEDVAVLSVTDARVTDMQTYTAPGDSFGDSDRTLTRTDRIAAEDVLVVRVDAPSFRGPLAAASGDSTTERFDSLVGSSEARFGFQEVDSGGQTEAVDLDLGESIAAGAVSVESHADGTLTLELAESDLVFDNGDNVGRQFEVDLVLDEDSGLTDDNRASDVEFRFTERSATFDTAGRDRIELPPSANATVHGSTTVAPGTEFDVEVRAGGVFLRENTTTVAPNRSFAARVDLSEASPGTEFTARLNEPDASAPGRVVQPEPTTATERGTENTSGGGATGSETAATPGTTDGVTITGSVTSETERPAATTAATPAEERTTTEEGPGFGVLAGLAAVLAVALLAWRGRR